MSRLTYTNVSLSKPNVSREPKSEDAVFHEEQRLRKKKSNKVAIYRPGQEPAGFNEDEEDDDTDLLSRKKKQDAKAIKKMAKSQPIVKAKEKRKGPRKIHTAQILIGGEEEKKGKAEPVEEVKIDVSQLEIQGDVTSSEDESEEDEMAKRRARARQRNKERAADEQKADKEAAEAAEQEAKEQEAEEESGSSEWETDTDAEEEDYTSSRPLLKPVFVSKRDRETIAERDRQEEKEREVEEFEKARLKQRKQESIQLVVDHVNQDEALEKAGKTGHELEGEEVIPNDDDAENEEEEIEQWKIRELTRIKRDKEKDAAEDKAIADVDRRRNMTDKEVEEENRLNPKKRREKGSMRYLQKYYHPGAYYQDDDEDGIRLRDFAQATGEDFHVDRTLLPKVLQVKKFGHKSRTKYTHLRDQDTSGLQKDDKPNLNPWADTSRDTSLQEMNSKHRMGGVDTGFSRPAKRSKK